METGKFIVFEGIDGSGKGSQIIRFAKYLFELDKKTNILLTREPTLHSEPGILVRKLLKEGKDPKENGKLFTDLYVQDREYHLKNLIIPALEKGVTVISDRYILSTLAYQQAQGMSLDVLLEMNSSFLSPDITFLLDVPEEVAYARINRVRPEEVQEMFDRAPLKFIEELRNNYLSLVKQNHFENVVLINANKYVEEVNKDIVFHYEGIIGKD